MAFPFTSDVDLYSSNILAPSPQFPLGFQDERYAFLRAGIPAEQGIGGERMGGALSMGAEFNASGQSSLELALPQAQHGPADEHGPIRRQPPFPSAVSAPNDSQWHFESATPHDQHGQWPTTPIASTQRQVYLDGFTAFASARPNVNWSFGDFVMATDSSVMPTQVENALDFEMSTQVEVPAALSASARNAAFAAQGETLTCPQGCPATFSRPVDYRRHMRSHQPHKFKCIFSGCDRTFPRMDKLNDHFRQGHRSEAPVKVSRAAARTNPKKAAGKKKSRR